MPAEIRTADLLDLPLERRLELVEALWDSIAADPDAVPVPDWHAAELDRRAALHADDPMSGEAWDVVKQRLLDKARRP